MILPRQGEGNDLAPYKNSQVFAKHLEVEAGFVEGDRREAQTKNRLDIRFSTESLILAQDER